MPTNPTATSAAAGIIFLGASYVEPGSTLPSTIAQALAQPFETHGVRGATLDRWLAETASVPLEGHHVIVGEFGGNGAPTVEQVRAAHERLTQRGAASVRWLAPPTGYPVEEINRRRIATLAAIESAGVPLVRVVFSVRGKTARDGQHLTEAGYRELGAAYADRITAGGGLASAIDRATRGTHVNGKALVLGGGVVLGLWLISR